MARAKYNRLHMPLEEVEEKEFLARRLNCEGVGFGMVRIKPGKGAEYVHQHRVQEEVFMTLEGEGTIILDGRRIPMPEGTIVRVAPEVNRAIGNESKRDVVFLIMGGIPPKNFPLGGRTLFGDGIPHREKVPRWKKPE
jgi:uncharacterized cupin superfamily protein